MKKIFAIIAFVLCLILVSCMAETTYKITYHDEGTILEMLYSPNEVIPNKDILGSSKEGYELEGWYFDDSFSSIVTFPYTVTESVDFYARWIKLHTITLIHGSSTIKTEKVRDGQTFENPGDPHATGAGVFKGWSSNKDDYVPFDFTTKIEADVVLYAFFEEPTPSTITVSFMDGDTVVDTKEIQENTVVSEVVAPSKEGYTFKGWSTDKDEFVEFNFETKLTENTTLYAFYTKDDVTPDTVAVTFKDGDSTLDSKTVEKNSVVSAITAPSKEGYTFKGWSTDKDEYASYDFSNLVSSDLTLYAYYEINTYTVTYKCNAETYTTQNIPYNTSAEAPKAPNLAGYAFVEWCIDEECKTPFDFSTKITDNITLYAKFEEVATHTLTLIIDGNQTQTQVNHNFTIDTAEFPTKEGYEIKDWYTDENYTTKFDVTTKITKDTTLYAHYTIKSFTVTFKDGEKVIATQIVEYNSTASVPNVNLEKEGYTFQGWSTDPKVHTGFNFITKIKEDTTIYACYHQNPTVTFMNGDAIVSTMTVTYDIGFGALTLPDNPTKTGYTFIGWSTSSSSYVPFDNHKGIKEDTTFHAYFEIQTVTVTFMNGSTIVSTQTINYDSTVTLPTTNPTKTGHTFKGWSTSSSSYVQFNASTKIKADTTLYAYFDIQTFIVTFMDGNTKIGDTTVDYNTTATFPSNPTKAGWVFKGWSSQEGSLIEFDKNTKITSNTTIYAYFVEEFTVTFNVDGTKTTVKVEDGSKVTEPQAPTKSGYSFDGWYLDNSKFNFNTPITESIELVASFTKLDEGQIEISNYSGYNEGLYFEATPVAGASLSDYSVQYKLASGSSWKSVDQQLIREQNSKIRCDIIGLPAGSYQVKIDVLGKTKTIACEVAEDDRSGYAHFNNTTGVGAYNNDGTLKSNAVVVYVTDATKNTVKATIGGKEYTGLVKIIQACTNSSYALDIRVLGEIQTTQWNFKEHGEGNTSTRQNNLEATFNYVHDTSNWDESSSGNYSKLNAADIISKGINSMSDDEAKGITKLNNLTNQVLRNKKPDSKTGAYEYDSYYNMLDVAGAYNITIEGIGTDAAIFQWGFAFKRCNSIEIKNLRFYNYTEDAVGFEGGSSTDKDYGNYWIHNCTFDIGVNNWDVCYENDKMDGDGSTDVKYCHNVTISYVQYNKTHKTNLIGSGDSALQYNITLHHNYYNNCGSRLPLVRQTNIHMYNNYYYKSTGYSNSIRANCYALVENCYYEAGQNPYEVVTTDTYKGAAIKAYNNVYNNVKISGSSYKSGNTVTSRTTSVTNTCKPDGSTDYSNFDTNSTLFYYDSAKQVSNVKNLLSPNDVPAHCKTYSGVLKANAKGLPSGTETEPDPTPSETWTNKLNETFSTSKTIQQSQTSNPTSAGIYYYTDATDNSQNDVTISGGTLHINDTSNKTTWGYYNFDSNTIKSTQSGKVKISVDFVPPTSSSKWTIVRFTDGENDIWIRTDGDKKLGYTINGETDGTNPVVHTIDSAAMVANKTYTVVLIIDYDKNEASVSINGGASVKLTGYSANLSINGLVFMTAGSATDRSYTIDNIVVDWSN